MIFEALDKIRRNAIFSAILLLAAGLVIMIIPLEFVPTLILGLGYGLVIIGLVMGLGFLGSKKSIMDYIKFVAALAIAIGGVAVLIMRDNTMPVFAWVFGVLLFLDGARTMIHSFTYARRSHRKAWWVLAILSIILLALGVILFITPWFNPLFSTPDHLMKAIGGTVLFAAIVSVFRLIWTWPVRKERKEVPENGQA